MAEEAGKAVWEGRPTWWGGCHWLAGCCGGQGRVSGRVGWWAGSDGGQGGWRGMDLQSKEYSGLPVSTVT